MKDQTSKTAKNRASALGKAKAAALSLFGASAVCLASASPLTPWTQRAKLQLHDHPIRGARHDGHGLRDLGGRGYELLQLQGRGGAEGQGGLAGMVGGGIDGRP